MDGTQDKEKHTRVRVDAVASSDTSLHDEHLAPASAHVDGKAGRTSWTPPLYVTACVVIAFGGMFNGLDTGIISPIASMDTFKADIASTSPTLHGLVVSSILIPAALISFFAGPLADSLGRPRAVALGAALFAAGAGIQAAAVHIAMFICGRMLAGAGEGLFLSTVVVYICELAPASRRGFMTALVQLLTTLGILIGYFTAYGTVRLASSASWRVPLALQAGLACVYAAVCLALPPSPRWLALCGRHADAHALWARLGIPRAEAAAASHAGLSALQRAAHAEKPDAVDYHADEGERVSRSLGRAFRADVRGRTALGVFIMAMQQLSGIDSMLYYAPLVFAQAGLAGAQASFLASGITAAVIVAVTVPGILATDKWPRRVCIFVGGVGMGVAMVVIGALYASGAAGAHAAARWAVVALIYIYVVVYCVTWGVCFRVYPSEIQPPVTRAAASNLAQGANWTTNFVVALVIPVFFAHSAAGPYFLFGIVTLANTLVCYFVMPETRGRALEDIDGSFRRSGASTVTTTSSDTDSSGRESPC